MFMKLVKTAEIEVEGRSYPMRFYVQRTAGGARRYSCEMFLDESDRIIFDGDSLPGLESRVERVAPATVYSRLLGTGY